MSEQNLGCSDKMSEANFSPAETLRVKLNRVLYLELFVYMRATS